MRKFILTGLLSCLTASSFACGIQGSIVYSDGSKADGAGRVSTSWNGKEVFARNGAYQLDLGDDVCGEVITVYIDGNNGREVRVNGWVTINFVLH